MEAAVAHAGSRHPDVDLAFAGCDQFDIFDDHRLLRLVEHRCAHVRSNPFWSADWP
jgi:hypothetical protein